MIIRQRDTSAIYSPVDAAAAQLAHDFNNLLSVIQAYAHLLHDQLHDESDKELAQEILAASSKGAALVRQLLVRTKARQSTVETAPLNDTIRNTTNQQRVLLGSNIIVRADLDENVGHVDIRAQELERCIMNLLANARDAIAGGGHIRIETSAQVVMDVDRDRPGLVPGNYAVMAVTDSGPGMSPRIQERIFEPFFSTKPGEGRGLGLAVVFGTAKDHGGYIEVDSREGNGSTFKLYLPRSRGQYRGEEEGDAGSAGASASDD